MKAFVSVAKLTCRSMLRSHVFHLLVLCLAGLLVLTLMHSVGDGTAEGGLRLMLEYSLGFTGIVLSFSAIWLTCTEVCRDAESGQLQMIAVKPVPRWVILLGKWFGVLILHFLLLVLASSAIYGAVLLWLANSDYSKAEKEAARERIMVARRKFQPTYPDFTKLAEKEHARRAERLRSLGRPAPELSGKEKRKEIEHIRRELIATAGEVPAASRGERMGEAIPAPPKTWTFEGLPPHYDGPLFLRSRFYDGRAVTQNQDMMLGEWIPLMHFSRKTDDGGTDWIPTYVALPVGPQISSRVNEFMLPRIEGAVFTDANGRAELRYLNFETTRPVNFQEADGPFLLLNAGSFGKNYVRTVAKLFIGVASMSMLACGFAAIFSLPIAVFLSAGYLLAGMLSSYLLGTFAMLDENPAADAFERLSYAFSGLIARLLVSFQDFFSVGELASGELVELSSIGALLLHDALLRTAPLFLLGAWIYSRRQLALAATKH